MKILTLRSQSPTCLETLEIIILNLREVGQGKKSSYHWIIKDGLRKLKAKFPEKAEKITATVFGQ